MTQAILIAGPCQLDDLAEQQGLIGGAGAYAAMAVAALVPCQLWARVGTDFPQACLQILERRRINLDGLIAEGTSNRLDAESFHAHGDILPDVSPHDAEELAACLCIDLPFKEAQRAWSDINKLKDADKRLRIQAPGNSCNNLDELKAWSEQADILIIGYGLATKVCKATNPIDICDQIQSFGTKTVILYNEHFGGLIAYKNKRCGFLSSPQSAKDSVGRYATFAGVLSAGLCSFGKLDFKGLKRAAATASAVAACAAQGIGPKKLLELRRDDYLQLYSKLRRNSKF